MKTMQITKPVRSKKGFGTLEMVIIIAVMLTVAMLFRDALSQYAGDLIDSVFKESIIEELKATDQP